MRKTEPVPGARYSAKKAKNQKSEIGARLRQASLSKKKGKEFIARELTDKRKG